MLHMLEDDQLVCLTSIWVIHMYISFLKNYYNWRVLHFILIFCFRRFLNWILRFLRRLSVDLSQQYAPYTLIILHSFLQLQFYCLILLMTSQDGCTFYQQYDSLEGVLLWCNFMWWCLCPHVLQLYSLVCFGVHGVDCQCLASVASPFIGFCLGASLEEQAQWLTSWLNYN